MIQLSQVNSDFNRHLFDIILQYFTQFGISISVRNTQNSYFLTVDGINNLFQLFLPELIKYSFLFYWKYPLLEMFIRVKKLMIAKVQLTELGTFKILAILYGYNTNRSHDLYYWIDLVKKFYAASANKNKSGHNHIQIGSSRNGQEPNNCHWKVKFPTAGTIDSPQVLPKNRQFTFYDDVSRDQALQKALEYRDNSIKKWINSVDSMPDNWPTNKEDID